MLKSHCDLDLDWTRSNVELVRALLAPFITCSHSVCHGYPFPLAGLVSGSKLYREGLVVTCMLLGRCRFHPEKTSRVWPL